MSDHDTNPADGEQTAEPAGEETSKTTDAGKTGPARVPHTVTAVAGAATGSVVSWGLFNALNVKDVIAHSSYGPVYALLIISVVAFATFLAAILALPNKITPDKRAMVMGGFALIGLLVLGSAAPFIYSAARRPPVLVEASFNPDLSNGQYLDRSGQPITLSAMLYNDNTKLGTLGTRYTQVWLDSGVPFSVEVSNLTQVLSACHLDAAEAKI